MMRRPIATLIGGFVGCLSVSIAASRTAQTQTPQQPQVFRSGTTVVPLDVTVLDRKGRPITDLTAADFTILEDKVPQRVSVFATQALALEGSPADRAALHDASELTPLNRRTFLVVLGYGRLQRPTNAIDATLTFLRQRLLPQDVVAVLMFDRVSDFTTDHEAVLHLVERYKAKQDDIVGAIETFVCHQHNQCPGAPVGMMIPLDEPPELPTSIQAEIDALFESPLPRTPGGMGSAVRFRSVRDLLFGTDIFKALNDEPYAVSWNLLLTRRDQLKVEGGFEYLRGQPSDKHLIALTPQPAIAGAANIQRFAERANSARVAVDLILTGGLPAVNTGRRGGFTQPQFFTAWPTRRNSQVSPAVSSSAPSMPTRS
jgi:VWFA-related protein